MFVGERGDQVRVVGLALVQHARKVAGSCDLAGVAVKFTVPTVANGKVDVGTQTELEVCGLLPN